QHEALAGRKVGHAPAGYRKTFADRRGRMLAFRLEEQKRITPEVLAAVHHRRVEAATHRRRAGDRVSPRRLGDVDLDVHHRLGPVTRRGNSRVLKPRLLLVIDRFQLWWRFAESSSAHQFPLAYSGSSNVAYTFRRNLGARNRIAETRRQYQPLAAASWWRDPGDGATRTHPATVEASRAGQVLGAGNGISAKSPHCLFISGSGVAATPFPTAYHFVALFMTMPV